MRSSTDYYFFVEKFLVPAMSLFVLTIPRLSAASKLYLCMLHGEIGDWFFTKEGTFIRLFGFFEAPFLLPIHVMDWIFSMEYTKQIDYVDSKYGIAMKKRIVYDLPYKVHDLVLQRRGERDQLKGKLLGVKLKKINQYLLCDLEDIFGKKLRS